MACGMVILRYRKCATRGIGSVYENSNVCTLLDDVMFLCLQTASLSFATQLWISSSFSFLCSFLSG